MPFHNISFGAGLFGHGFINFLASDLLLCPFHKKLEICKEISFVSSQTVNQGFSFIMYRCCIAIEACSWYLLLTYQSHNNKNDRLT